MNYIDFKMLDMLMPDMDINQLNNELKLLDPNDPIYSTITQYIDYKVDGGFDR